MEALTESALLLAADALRPPGARQRVDALLELVDTVAQVMIGSDHEEEPYFQAAVRARGCLCSGSHVHASHIQACASACRRWLSFQRAA